MLIFRKATWSPATWYRSIEARCRQNVAVSVLTTVVFFAKISIRSPQKTVAFISDESFMDQSIQKTFNLMLKTEEMADNSKAIATFLPDQA